MSIFEAGKTYAARSACDHECIWKFKVVSRTSKTLLLQGEDGKARRRGISADASGEYCLPLGSYSMAPVLRAEREA